MATYRSFLFPESEVLEDSIVLERRESHHLVKVFRARVGERVELLNGKGKRYFGELVKADAKAAVVRIEQVEEVPVPDHEVVLLQALPKTKAMDLLLRIVTEIGISKLQPVYSSQSEVHLQKERVEGKMEKWRATTIEACKQCGLPFLPELFSPVDLKTWLGDNPAGLDELRIVASLEAGSGILLETLSNRQLPKRIVLAVGPEGDFSGEEYATLRESSFTPVRLGANVLRAETATAYMLSVLDQVLLSGETGCVATSQGA
ncbi:MAG: RsmE family RNA methyltransferase [Opitutales bacterium]